MTTYLLGAIVRLWSRLSKGGIDKWERGRARSIAAASAPMHGDVLPAADLALVEAHHEMVVEYRTGEFRDLAFDVDPLTAPIPVGYAQAEAALFNGVVSAAWFTQAWPTGPSVPFSSVQVCEPDPLELESFTGTWRAADVARMVAEYKTGANR